MVLIETNITHKVRYNSYVVYYILIRYNNLKMKREKKVMKKIIIILVVTLIMMSICACGGMPKDANIIEFNQTFEYEDFIISFISFENAVDEAKEDKNYNFDEDGYAYKLTYNIEYSGKMESFVKMSRVDVWPKKASNKDDTSLACFNRNEENNYSQVNSSWLYLRNEEEEIYIVLGDNWLKLR